MLRRVQSPRVLLSAPATVLALVIAACGGDSGPKAPAGVSQSTFERQLEEAQTARVADFPAADGKTLQPLADTAAAGPSIGLATSVFVPGENRLAFGVLASRTARSIGRPRSTLLAARPHQRGTHFRRRPAPCRCRPGTAAGWRSSTRRSTSTTTSTRVSARPSARSASSEPWLFTVTADGRVAARLEGSFGVRAFDNAIKAALSQAPA